MKWQNIEFPYFHTLFSLARDFISGVFIINACKSHTDLPAKTSLRIRSAILLLLDNKPSMQLAEPARIPALSPEGF